MKPDDLVPLAGPGATVPALPEPLAARRIRGVVSDGMLCSPWELGITTEHTGILVIPDELEPGTDFKQAYGLDDSVLDIEVTLAVTGHQMTQARAVARADGHEIASLKAGVYDRLAIGSGDRYFPGHHRLRHRR